MQNSFEKQVQDKMDELKFVPTEPVWQNIEKQIRSKKDRRRFLLWLPLLLLLLCGGVWWLNRYNLNSKDTIAVEQKNKIEKKQSASVVQNKQNKTAGNNGIPLISMQAKEKAKPVPEPAVHLTVSSISFSTQVKEKKHKALSVNNTSPSIAGYEKQTTSEEALIHKAGKNTEATTSLHEDSVTSVQAKVDEPSPINTVDRDSVTQNKTVAIQLSINNDSLQAETVQTNTVKESGASKWKLGFMANAGISGVAKGFGSVSLNKSFDAAPSYSTGSGTTQVPAPAASPVKNDVAFSAGVIAAKKINKRFSFSTGLQYRYYSTHMAVGQIRRQDSIMSGNLRISQFYLNSGTGFKNYHNSYHFISFPAMIDWQVFRKMPLYVQAGLSLQQLIRTNALLFDGRNNIYYNDNSVFHKTQLFSAFSLSYKAFDAKEISVLLGPQLQYGLSNLEKNKSGKHLFSLGLTVQILFQKK